MVRLNFNQQKGHKIIKRFTETLKWSKPWFRQLEPRHKLLWQWMCDTCDNAGILDADWGLASFQIGFDFSFNASDIAIFGDRIVSLPCGKVWIRSFIEFQVSTLSRECKAHGPIFTSLDKHGIDPDSLSLIGYPIGYKDNSHRVCNTLKEKEKDKDKELDKEKVAAEFDLDSGNEPAPKTPRQPKTSHGLRIHAMFNRGPKASWTDKELKALSGLEPFDSDDFDMVESHYLTSGDLFTRKDVQTFLNNYQGEVDRVRGKRNQPKSQAGKYGNLNPQRGVC